jgi:hypothetical protein
VGQPEAKRAIDNNHQPVTMSCGHFMPKKLPLFTHPLLKFIILHQTLPVQAQIDRLGEATARFVAFMPGFSYHRPH